METSKSFEAYLKIYFFFPSTAKSLWPYGCSCIRILLARIENSSQIVLNNKYIYINDKVPKWSNLLNQLIQRLDHVLGHRFIEVFVNCSSLFSGFQGCCMSDHHINAWVACLWTDHQREARNQAAFQERSFGSGRVPGEIHNVYCGIFGTLFYPNPVFK